MNDFKNIISLIAIYIIITDKEIDNKEVAIIYNYNKNLVEIEDEINNIYSDSENKILLDDLLHQLSTFSYDVILEAYQLFLEVIYSDGYYAVNEKSTLDYIREKLHIDETDLYKLENKVLSNIKLYDEKEIKWSDTYKELFYGLMLKISKQKTNYYEKKQKEILLNGPKFVEKIIEISELAKHDLIFVEKIISESSNRFSNLLDRLVEFTKIIHNNKRKDEQLDSFTSTLKNIIEEKSLAHLKENIEIINKKKRTIDYFTISFLGRTKAGKSTLHSIITKEGNEAIGEGKIRTTRYNRVYNWENLRIIDTPGIGAPNGLTDVAIAESIVEESDLICYIVTNDAIQETEFRFLSEIRKKNKPVVILLNVKENIENESRKNLFLKNPTKWKERTDSKCINGHIDRINEYMKKFYKNNYFKVIPVMLLSAKLSEYDSDNKTKKILYDASNIEEFLTSLKETVFDNGHLRKSQNIIDGSNYRLFSIYDDFNKQYKLISDIIDRLKKEKVSFSKYLNENKTKFENNLIGVIGIFVTKLKKLARDFSINNYMLNEKEINIAWEDELKRRGYINQLENEIKNEFSNIQENIKNRLNESIDSIQLFFNNLEFKLETQATHNTRSIFTIGGSLIGAGGSIVIALGLFSNPIGWAITIAGILVGLSSLLFKSKQTKIEEAQTKIESSIINGIIDVEKEYKEQIIKHLNKLINDYDKTINDNMINLIENAENIKKILESEINYYKKQIDLLNQAIIIRIFQHTKQIELVKDIEKAIQNNKLFFDIDRDFESNVIKLKINNNLNINELSKISEIVQSELKILN
ncbi:50S ribosome-binding GTPase [Candidatus Gracilibacteria bacterium]|nr:50S ribosome-binding GTPase [Candidatus Gracilibacteria bacterium]